MRLAAGPATGPAQASSGTLTGVSLSADQPRHHA
jgi:hypothetical protein